MSRLLGGRLPPGPPLPAPLRTLLIWRSPLQFLECCRRRYGPAFTVRITSHPPLVFLSDPEDIKAMFAAPPEVLHPGEGTQTIEPLVGEQAFMLREQDEHLSTRKLVLSAFHRNLAREHAEMVAEVAQREVSSWPRGTAIALHPRLRALTLQVILRTIFGSPGCLAEDRIYALRDRLLEMLSVAGSAVLPEPLLRHGPGRLVWRRFLHDRAALDRVMYAIIEDGSGAREQCGGLFGELLRAHNPDGSRMSHRQIRDNLMSVILAGHETTAAELAWAFQLLAHNPLVLGRLLEEIDANAGEEYLTATVYEVLRHRPVFLFGIPRAVKQPIVIGERTYRPPAQLLGCIYLVHHDPAVYPDPEEFRPERFVHSPPGRSTWLAWGGGRKRCPGLHLATLEMKTVLRTVLADMTVQLAAKRIERPRWRSVIVSPHAGSRVVLQPRN